jgi:hypothetical protein
LAQASYWPLAKSCKDFSHKSEYSAGARLRFGFVTTLGVASEVETFGEFAGEVLLHPVEKITTIVITIIVRKKFFFIVKVLNSLFVWLFKFLFLLKEFAGSIFNFSEKKLLILKECRLFA